MSLKVIVINRNNPSVIGTVLIRSVLSFFGLIVINLTINLIFYPDIISTLNQPNLIALFLCHLDDNAFHTESFHRTLENYLAKTIVTRA